jgi:hypothetical protein
MITFYRLTLHLKLNNVPSRRMPITLATMLIRVIMNVMPTTFSTVIRVYALRLIFRVTVFAMYSLR